MGATRESPVSRAAIEWVYRIHTRPGPGLPESVYEAFPTPRLTAPGHEGMRWSAQCVLSSFGAHRIEEGIAPSSP